MAEQTITCPKCGKRIPVSKALTSQIEQVLRKDLEKEARNREKQTKAEYEKKLSDERERAYKQASKEAKSQAFIEVSELRKQLAQSKRNYEAEQRLFEKQLAQERDRARKDAKKEAKAEISEELKELKRENWLKASKIAELKNMETELKAERVKLEAKQKSFDRQVAQVERKAEEKAAKRAEAKYEDKMLKKDKQLHDLQKQIAELEKKSELSSQQLQGEVYERHLEGLLKSAFPDDEIKAVAKGKSGADVVQRVYSSSGNFTGTIIWESKDTKNFNKSWLPKLRGDQRRAKAQIAVIVSTTLPKDWRSSFGQLGGVWVTDFANAVALATALRVGLIDVSSVKLASEGKEEKLEVIYEYLTGVEFKHRVEAIVEAFVNMKTDLDKERMATERSWSKREKQINTVLQNLAGMHGEMQALVGRALPQIKQLELPASQN